MDETQRHEDEVRQRVRAVLRAGKQDFEAVLAESEGADPVLVESVLAAERLKAVEEVGDPAQVDAAQALSYRLPAADPERSQWWFSPESVDYLVETCRVRTGPFDKPRVLCLGTPTLGPTLANRGYQATVWDADADVLKALQGFRGDLQATPYDVANKLPTGFFEAFDIVILDPPWYEGALYRFVGRGLEALRKGGEMLCVLPGRLTRPGLDLMRSTLVKDLMQGGHELLGLERGTIHYLVPRFELAALGRIENFRGIPWRAADLLHVRKVTNAGVRELEAPAATARSFSRVADEFRVFSRSTNSLEPTIPLRLVDGYDRSVSTRAYAGREPDVWTSEKAGIQVSNVVAVEGVLDGWQRRLSIEDCVRELVPTHGSEAYLTSLAQSLDESLALWSKFGSRPPIREEPEISKARQAALSPLATGPSDREHIEWSDSYRPPFQRDRDRILWSAGLRRLSNKTQLYPASQDDHLRQRLTHSVEVMQLAETIGASFGLDGDLIQAGALAHDIGHTPFGHAGEHALNRLFNEANPSLGGFSHYEHGVDIIRYLEGPYYVSQASSFFGLNLTPEVAECVIKHTFCQGGKDEFSTEAVLGRSKHSGGTAQFIPAGYCHLEGQAVRAADKISYLVSDIEDGLRLGALSLQDLAACRFFHRPPFSFRPEDSRSAYEQYLSQRRWVIKLLMEDILRASSKKLAAYKPQSAKHVRDAGDYLIQHSSEMLKEMGEIWDRLQAGKLHKERRVVAANRHAAKVVRELTLTFCLSPELVEARFRDEHSRLDGTWYLEFYSKQVGKTVKVPTAGGGLVDDRVPATTTETIVPVRDLVMAKDYVASLSDARAQRLHHQLSTGKPLWT